MSMDIELYYITETNAVESTRIQISKDKLLYNKGDRCYLAIFTD